MSEVIILALIEERKAEIGPDNYWDENIQAVAPK